MPVHRGHGNVKRLTRGGKMNLELPGSVAVFQKFSQKAPDRLPDRHRLSIRKETVAVKLDEGPFWSSQYADARAAPAVQAGKVQGIVPRQHAIIQARYGQSPEAAPPVENKRAGKDYRQPGGHTDA